MRETYKTVMGINTGAQKYYVWTEEISLRGQELRFQWTLNGYDSHIQNSCDFYMHNGYNSCQHVLKV